MNPKISVVMAVYNGEKYLNKSIESILKQTFEDFEFLIINDGSTDSSLEIVKSYKGDKRIKILDNIENKGLIFSLNRGLKEAKGSYIARIDADDIAYKNRLERQFDFMEKNKEIVLLGSGMEVVFEGIPFLKRRVFTKENYEKIKVELLFSSVFVHPSVMLRKETLDRNNLQYEEKYKNAEDYGLWTNIASVFKCSNIREPLIKYRIVKRSITRIANKDMESRKEVFKMIYKNYFEKLGIYVTDVELELHFECCMIQNLGEFKFTIEEKKIYLKNLFQKMIYAKLNFEYSDKVIKKMIEKILIYQNENTFNLVRNKRYYQELIKKNIKKYYK